MKVNPDQFKLFMTGTEWQAHVTHSRDGPVPELWKQKEAQTRHPGDPSSQTGPHGAGLYESIRTKGYQSDHPGYSGSPTIILEDSPSGKDVRRVQSEGHHRVAAAAAVERDTGKPVYIPTNYVDNTLGSQTRRAVQAARDYDQKRAV